MLLRVQGLSKRFNGEVLFEDMSFDASPGETVGILGPSGCGKTTLLRVIAGLDSEYSGQVTYDGTELCAPSRLCAVVFQEGRLLPWFRAWQNVAFAFPDVRSKAESREEAVALLESVGLPAIFANHWP